MAAIGQQLGALGKNGCGGCHETFREKKYTPHRARDRSPQDPAPIVSGRRSSSGAEAVGRARGRRRRRAPGALGELNAAR